MRSCSSTISFILHHFVFVAVAIIVISLGIAFPVHAVSVRSIGIQPSSPVYGEQFDCLFDVDVAEPNLACGLLTLDSSSDALPWDICPKKEGTPFGRHEMGPPTATYGCIASPMTKVPGPGQYRIVAWYFTQDGAKGEIINQMNITIVGGGGVAPTQIQAPTRIPTIAVPTATKTPIQPTKYIPPSSAPIPTITRTQVPTSYFEIGNSDINTAREQTPIQQEPQKDILKSAFVRVGSYALKFFIQQNSPIQSIFVFFQKGMQNFSEDAQF